MAGRLRLVGACVLTVLALLPAAGTLCIALCQPGSGGHAIQHHDVRLSPDATLPGHHATIPGDHRPPAHHHDASPVGITADASGATLRAPHHDCRAHDITLQASIVTERAGWQAVLTALGPATGTSTIDAMPLDGHAHGGISSPPPRTSSAPLSLPLRI